MACVRSGIYRNVFPAFQLPARVARNNKATTFEKFRLVRCSARKIAIHSQKLARGSLYFSSWLIALIYENEAYFNSSY